MYERIVVPLDGSAFGEYAIPFATRIGSRTGASIELVHVHIPEAQEEALDSFTPFQFQGVTNLYAANDRSALRREREAIADRASELSHSTGLEVTSRVLMGRVDTAVENEAEFFHADLIVLSTHARSGLARLRFGNVADAVIRRAKMPVLVLRPPEVPWESVPEPHFGRMVIPLDGSYMSHQVLAHAATFARLFESDVAFIHVDIVHGQWKDVAPGRLPTVGAPHPYLANIAAQSAHLFDEPSLESTYGEKASDAILDAAERLGAGVIAMATHGRGGIVRMLTGSTTDDVLHRTRLPVLLYRSRPIGAADQPETSGAMYMGLPM
jgi:nucleotide-binding universal stress UspA family protein